MICCLNPDCNSPLNQDIHKYCQHCGTELIPLLRNRFKIIQPLGRGGFGKTYLADDTDKLNKPCVIKQLFYQGRSSNANQKIIELFVREAEQLYKLKANQQIPNLLAYFEESEYLYLAQEYVDGQDLLTEIHQQGPFDEDNIKELFLGLLPVLQFIHKKGVIHRDIKPENIMRRKGDNRLVLIDFGVARTISMSQLTTTGTKVGSPGYFSIEQFIEGKATASSDLYSLGATAFHLLTEQYPGDLWTMQGYGWVNDWQRYLDKPINPTLVAVINKLLQVQAECRYQNAASVLEELNLQFQESNQTQQAVIQHQANSQIFKSQTPIRSISTSSVKTLPHSQGKSVHKRSLVGLTLVSLLIGGSYIIANLTTNNIPKPLQETLSTLSQVDTSSNVLSPAKQQASKGIGNLGEAIKLAKSIDNNSLVYKEAQLLIAQWESKWEQENMLFMQSREAYDAGRWEEAYDLAFRIPRNEYWDNNRELNTIAINSKNHLNAINTSNNKPENKPKQIIKDIYYGGNSQACINGNIQGLGSYASAREFCFSTPSEVQKKQLYP